MDPDTNQTFSEQAASSGVHVPGVAAPGPAQAAPAQPVPDPIDSPFGGGSVADTPLEGESEDEAQPDASQEGILRQRLAQRRRKLASTRDPLYLEVPGYADLGLEAEYKFVTPERLGRNGHKLAKIQNQVVQNIAASKATLVECCAQFWINVGASRIPLSTSGVPAKYDRQMVKELGGNPGEIKSAADAVSWLFENDYAVAEHAKKVNDWLASSMTDDEESGVEGFESGFAGA